MNKLSVVIITYNEERNIYRCISSVKDIADEVIVLDSFSTDRTVVIAKQLGAKVYQQQFDNYVAQKNEAIALATNDWILSIDADEVVTSHLRQSIYEALKQPSHMAYRFARKTNYCGKWVKYCGWYPDWKTRLFNRQHGIWKGELIHEYWQRTTGATEGTLDGNLLHYSFYSLSDHLRKVDAFSEVQARLLYSKGKRILLPKLLLGPFWRFMDGYFFKMGFLDGMTGFNICIMSAYANFMKLAKARNLQISERNRIQLAMVNNGAQNIFNPEEELLQQQEA